MTEPERLEVGGPRRRPGWLVLLVAVAVLGALVIVRLSSLPSPMPDVVRPPGSTASARTGAAVARLPWPAGQDLPSGTLYVLASNDVYSVDVAGGLVQPLGLERFDPDRTVLTAMAPGVLVWSTGGQPKRRFWYAGGPVEQSLGPLRSAAQVLPASGEEVWTAERQDRRPSTDATWVLTGDRGATGPRVHIRGLAVPDGAGGLLDVERTRVRLAGPAADHEVVGTYLLGVGPDGLVVGACAASSCTPELRDHATGRTTALGPTAPDGPDRATTVVDPGALSPGNRFLAASGSDQNGGFELRVSVATAPLDVVRTIPVGSSSTDLTWLSDRWLVATSADGLLLYDAADDTVVVPSLPFAQPTRLVFQPTA